MLTHSLGNLQMPSTKSKGRYQLTLEQKEEFTTSFQLFDTDGKGAIDLHELKVRFSGTFQCLSVSIYSCCSTLFRGATLLTSKFLCRSWNIWN